MNKIKGTFHEISEDVEKVIETRRQPKPWRQDPKGYFLIKVNKKDGIIEVGFCSNDHHLKTKFIGTNADEMYHAIVKEGLVSLLVHAAYLGKELTKAELYLKGDHKEYTQD